MAWSLVGNEPHAPSCEDPTPYFTIRCDDCEQLHHVHQSQVPPTRAAGMTCARCGQLILFKSTWLRATLARL
jgi:ribosomal protein S27E